MEQLPKFNSDQPEEENHLVPIEEIRKAASQLAEMLPDVISYTQDLFELKNRTPEEKKEFQKMVQLMQKLVPVVSNIQDFFGERAFKQVQAYYYHIKELSEKGDQEAKKIYDDLRPLYENAISDQINEN